MFPYGWMVVFSVGIFSFFVTNSSWGSFFLCSPKMEEDFECLLEDNFWQYDL